MNLKIAHISDVHLESGDEDLSRLLRESLKHEQPDYLVFTGDLVNNPLSKEIQRGKDWLLQLCAAAGLEAATRLVIIRGNHDIRLLGNVGFRPLSGRQFLRAFKPYVRKRVVPAENLPLVFLRIDSNPVIWGFARGRVGWLELRKIRKELRDFGDELEKQKAGPPLKHYTKIALVHHHVLPIPYEGRDSFLVLTDAQNLLQFLAEKNVDVVLHGHKHSAPYSLLSLGTCGGGERVVEVLGAGTPINLSDHDDRGPNYNLICIEDTGLRYVRQLFALDKREFKESFHVGFVQHALRNVKRHALENSDHRYRAIRWVMTIDVEGDRFNQLSYEGLEVTDRTSKRREIYPPNYKVQTGHLSDVRVNERLSTPGVTRKIIKSGPREIEFQVLLPYTPILDHGRELIDFTLESYDFNGSALNAVELKKKFPGRSENMEWDEKLIKAPMDEFSWAIQFPQEMHFDAQHLPEFEVLDGQKQRHEWLTRALKPCFHYSAGLHTAFLVIHDPPVGYQCRIKWHVPDSPRVAEPDAGPNAAKAMRFAQAFLSAAKLRESGKPLPHLIQQTQAILGEFLNAVAEFVAKACHDQISRDSLDVSYMVCDQDTQDRPAELRVMACAGKHSDNFWDFKLEVGDGNAGRAFKSGVVRFYDTRKQGEQAFDDLRHQAYIPIEGMPPHEFLASIPLKLKLLNFGVVNIGTFSREQALQFRMLTDPHAIIRLTELAYEKVLAKLLEICNIKIEDHSDPSSL